MMKQSLQETPAKSSASNLILGLGLVIAGIGFGAAGIYVGEMDDAPGAALIGLLLMIGAMILGIRIARRKS